MAKLKSYQHVAAAVRPAHRQRDQAIAAIKNMALIHPANQDKRFDGMLRHWTILLSEAEEALRAYDDACLRNTGGPASGDESGSVGRAG